MKKIIILFLLSFSNFGFEHFPVHRTTEIPGRYLNFKLKSYRGANLTLDCSSFLYGITLKTVSRNDFLYLYEGECYDLAEKLLLYSDVKEQACLSIDFTKKDWKLEKGVGDCQ